MSGPRVLVIGGANTDVVGIPDGRFALRDSNPGHVRVSMGGVGRNIAENLARLGAAVRLVTAFGDDTDGAALREGCERAGIDISMSVVAEGVPASRYLAVLDGAGDLAAAVSDMRALEQLTPDRLTPAMFAGVDAVVLDTNMPPTTLARAAEYAGDAPVVLDPVSTAKALAARTVLARLAVLKANVREAEEISGAAGAEGAAERLLQAGVARVIITMGSGGVLCASRAERFRVAAPRASVVNATGAGDAFAAGVTYGLASGLRFRDIIAWGSALAAFALESEFTVSDRVSLDAVRHRKETA